MTGYFICAIIVTQQVTFCPEVILLCNVEMQKGEILLLVSYNSYEGEPIRIYRHPRDIRGDIAKIKDKIAETDNMINVRSLLLDALSEIAEGDPDKWLPEIEEIVEDARATLEDLRSLETTLKELEEELKSTRWVMGYAGNA